MNLHRSLVTASRVLTQLRGDHRTIALMLVVPCVLAVHDLHVWSIASGMVALSCHVVVEGGRDGGKVLSEVNRALAAGFRIDHTTIQIEPEGFEEGGVCA